MTMPDVWTVVTSAGVAALVSSLLGFVGQYFERRARQQELVLSKALDLATERVRLKFEAAKKTGALVDLGEIARTAVAYVRFLRCLVQGKRIPEDLERELF